MGNATSTVPIWQDMVGFGGVRDLAHVWMLSTWKSGDPASSLINGKRQEGGINEGENPRSRVMWSASP